MKISFLGTKTFFTLIFISALIFITVGDIILPKPLNLYSRNTRNTLEQALLGVFPDIDSESKRPSRKREGQVKEFYQKAAPSSNPN